MNSFLKELAKAQPNPGGGAAAAFGARLGLALLEKVVCLEGQRPVNPKGYQGLAWEETLARLRRLAELLRELQERDVQAYSRLTAARVAGDAPAPYGRGAGSGELSRRDRPADRGGPETAGLGRGTLPVAPALRPPGGLRISGGGPPGGPSFTGTNLPLVGNEASRQGLARKLRQSWQRDEDLYRRVQGALLARENGLV